MFILVNAPGALRFSSSENDIIGEKTWTNIKIFDVLKPCFGGIWSPFHLRKLGGEGVVIKKNIIQGRS